MDGLGAQQQTIGKGQHAEVRPSNDHAISESVTFTLVRACDQHVTFEEAPAQLAAGTTYSEVIQPAEPISFVEPERRPQGLPFSYTIDRHGRLHSEREVMQRALAAYHRARHPQEYRAVGNTVSRKLAANACDRREEETRIGDGALDAMVDLQGAGRQPREVLRDLFREVQAHMHRRHRDGARLPCRKGIQQPIDSHLVDETARRTLSALLAARPQMLSRRDVRDQWWNWCLLFHPQQNSYCFSVMTHWHSAKVVPMERREN